MTEQVHDPESIRELSNEECWDVIRRNQMGHLAYAVVGLPGIVPINYLESDGRILFRTAEGGKLLGVTINQEVAFEVDEIGMQIARTVIVKGHGAKLEDAEAAAADALPIHPWVKTYKHNIVAITPTEITGREFHFEP